MLFERYREVIPDWNAFQESIQSRDPTTIRVRTGRIASSDLIVRLVGQGFLVEEIQGVPRFIRVLDGPFNVADTIEHWLGLFYVQQVSTGLAALALQPNPGEHILDLCAAPGNSSMRTSAMSPRNQARSAPQELRMYHRLYHLRRCGAPGTDRVRRTVRRRSCAEAPCAGSPHSCSN